MVSLLLVLHLAFTGYMTGLIWFVQLVHYPLMSNVGAADYPEYQRQHMRMTTWAVSPMLPELAATLCLLWAPVAAPLWARAAGLSLLLIIWGSTALLQVPAHNALLERFQASVHRRLVVSNWIRTGAWSSRLALACWFVALQLEAAAGRGDTFPGLFFR